MERVYKIHKILLLLQLNKKEYVNNCRCREVVCRYQSDETGEADECSSPGIYK